MRKHVYMHWGKPAHTQRGSLCGGQRLDQGLGPLPEIMVDGLDGFTVRLHGACTVTAYGPSRMPLLHGPHPPATTAQPLTAPGPPMQH